MLWSVILMSLKHSGCASSKTAALSVFENSVLKDRRFLRTPRPLPRDCRVRTVTTTAKAGKTYSVPRGNAVTLPEKRFPGGAACSRKKLDRSPSPNLATEEAAASANGSVSKAVHVALASKRPLNDVFLFKEHTIALESSNLSESTFDCIREGMPERLGSSQDTVKHKREDHLLFLFPVNILSQWWSDCFLPGYGTHTDTRYCLHKLYVWLGAYQRVHLDTTGIYLKDHNASILSKELASLKTAVSYKVFRWGDVKNIYLHSPLGCGPKRTRFSSDVDTTFIFQDRVVQEVLFLILEPVFEARFSTRSHASRPDRGVHTALRAAQRSFLGCKWFIAGDLIILDEANYAHHLLESVLKVVRDSRVAFLLRCAFTQDRSMCASFLHASQGSSGRLRHFLCNVLLDSLDWWMDDQIRNFSKQEIMSNEFSTKEILSLSRNCLKQPYKLEYVRYGTKFWVGCNATEKKIKSIEKDIALFLKKTFGDCLTSNMVVIPMFAGVSILDHRISEKIVRPVYRCRRASNGMVFEKRAFEIKLSLKASIAHCSKYLRQLEVPASLQQIEQILSVLSHCYCYAENKAKVLAYCKLKLCYIYSTKGSLDKCKEGPADGGFAKDFKKVVQSVACLEAEQGNRHCSKTFIRIPEHEKVFRDQAWLQSRGLTSEVRESFKNMQKPSPQQIMSQVLWQYLGAACDNSLVLNEQHLTS